MQIIYKGKGVCATRIGHVASGYSIVEKKCPFTFPEEFLMCLYYLLKELNMFSHSDTIRVHSTSMFSDWFIFHVYSKSMMYTVVCSSKWYFIQTMTKVSMWKTLCDQLVFIL